MVLGVETLDDVSELRGLMSKIGLDRLRKLALQRYSIIR
jgi:hypothetical protein